MSLGSVIGIFSATGAYEGGYSYSPYSEPRTTSTNTAVTANILRYITGEQDAAGFLHERKRPGAGNFHEQDWGISVSAVAMTGSGGC